MAAAPKPPDFKEPKSPPPRMCIICCDGNEDSPVSELMKPCRGCDSDYCTECLIDMFTAPVTDNSRMPPRCCSLIQIHTVLRHLTDKQANDYRQKFEEWITPTKTYCPSPTCSAFISERLLPPSPPSPTLPQSPVSSLSGKPPPASLKPVILEVLEKVTASQSARFFRGELLITELPGFAKVVQRHMDLGIIRGNIDVYRSMSNVTADMNLIVSNAIEYNGKDHPVTEAAHELEYIFNVEVADAMDRLIQSPGLAAPSTSPRFFPCPQCHVAICTRCRQIEHGENPCDHSAADAEMAMLQSLRCKRCPRCRAGVRKMYGCGHMQCRCGAHWCYYCEKSLTECEGACAEDRGEDESDDDGSNLEDYDSELDEMEEDDHTELAVEIARGNSAPSQPPAQNTSASIRIPAPVPVPNHRMENLDAGGGRRWAGGDYDFGDEPEEEGVFDVWCCTHKFEGFVAAPRDGFNHGDLDRMECNRCFDKVVGKQRPPPKTAVPKKRSKLPPWTVKNADVVMKDEPPAKLSQDTKEKEALECVRCRIIVCATCRDKYYAAKP